MAYARGRPFFLLILRRKRASPPFNVRTVRFRDSFFLLHLLTEAAAGELRPGNSPEGDYGIGRADRPSVARPEAGKKKETKGEEKERGN